VGLFDMEPRARVCVFLPGWSSLWAFLAWREGRVCALVGLLARVCFFWPVGTASGPFWHGG